MPIPAEIDAVQWTAFLDSIPADAQVIWKAIAGSAPRQVLPALPPQSQVEGVMRGYDANIVTQPSRVDFVLNFVDPGGTPMPIKDLPAAMDIGSSMLIDALATLPKVNRIALVLQFTDPVADDAELAIKFTARVPTLTLKAGAKDLLLQLNVPAIGRVSGLKLNRLCRWFSASKQIYTPVGSGGRLAISLRPNLAEHVDVSMFDSRPLDAKSLLLIIQDIKAEAIELAEHGYGYF